jgi:hypothetical protein
MEGRATLSESQRAQLAIAKSSWLGNDASDAVLLSTRGGDRYDRTFGRAYIRPGLDAHNWVSRANYPALGVVPTGPAEMSLYVQRHTNQKTHYLERMTLRTDGFASAASPVGGGVGELRTRLLTFTGDALEINYATSAAGSISVELQDAAGQPIPGFTAKDCLPLMGDAIEQKVEWRSSPSLRAMSGKPVRLRAILQDADLYALHFSSLR